MYKDYDIEMEDEYCTTLLDGGHTMLIVEYVRTLARDKNQRPT